MHLNIKKLLATISATVIAVTALSGYITTTYAVDKYPTSGKCGDNVDWLINSDGVLIITGEGQMTQPSGGWSWGKLDNDINEVVIENGITSVNSTISPFGYYYCRNISKITLPPSLTNLYGCIDLVNNFTNLKDIYIYSKDISDVAYQSNSYPGDVIWHVYKDSITDKSLRNNLKLTDKDIKYIPDNENMPTVGNHQPVELEQLTDTSGPSGLSSKWEWDKTSKTLSFSGTGIISIGDYFKSYAGTAEHIIINAGITGIQTISSAQTLGVLKDGAFANFTNLKDIKLPETLQVIGAASFYNDTSLTTVDLPSTSQLEKIDNCAFQNTNIEGIALPESLMEIGECAFQNTNIKSINLHENMIIGGCAFKSCELLTEVTIPKNTEFILTTIGGMGMGRAPATFSDCTKLEKVIIDGGSTISDTWGHIASQNGIEEDLFSNCTSLTTVKIRDVNIDYIGPSAFRNCPALTDIYFYNTNLSTITAKDTHTGTIYSDSITTTTKNPTFYVIKDSTTETTLKNAGYLTNSNTVYLATKDDIDKLENAIKSFDDNVDTSKYTEDYAKDFNDALEKGKDILNKYNLDNYSGITLNEVNDVLNVLNNIKYKSADYTAVDAAIAKIPSDLSKYTEESVNKLQDAVNNVDRTKNINEQDIVDNYAKAIEDAIKGLVQKTPATTPTDPTKSPSVHPTANVPIVTAPKTRSDSEVAKDKAAAEKIVKQAKITKLKVKSKAKKKITVTWKKVKKAVGYEVQVSKKKNFKKNIFDKFTSKKKITFKKKLKSGKTYYVRVRAYATYKDKNGVECKVYSKWNKKLRKVKVK